MRIRTIKPAFWESETIAELSDLAKLVFIGTWNLADDAGYFRWSVRKVAGELFRYERPERRERKADRALAELMERELLVVLECGRHANVPNLEKHQHLSGKTSRVYTYRNEHTIECLRGSPREDAGSPQKPAETRSVGEGRGMVEERNGEERARANGTNPEETIDSLRKLIADPATAEVARVVARRQLAKLGAEEGESDG